MVARADESCDEKGKILQQRVRASLDGCDRRQATEKFEKLEAGPKMFLQFSGWTKERTREYARSLRAEVSTTRIDPKTSASANMKDLADDDVKKDKSTSIKVS